jgi:DNA-binding MarR family transcriptional regulator
MESVAAVTRSPLDTAELDAAVGFWLRLAQHRELKTFQAHFGESGVGQLAYAILLVLEANPGCRQSDLGAAVEVRQPNLVEPLETLAARGLVSRTPDPRDRRAQVLALTGEGARLLAELKAIHARMIDSYREALGPRGYDTLVELLRRFTAA